MAVTNAIIPLLFIHIYCQAVIGRGTRFPGNSPDGLEETLNSLELSRIYGDKYGRRYYQLYNSLRTPQLKGKTSAPLVAILGNSDELDVQTDENGKDNAAAEDLTRNDQSSARQGKIFGVFGEVGSGSFSASHSFSMLGKIINAALALSYGTNGYFVPPVPPFPVNPVNFGGPIRPTSPGFITTNFNPAFPPPRREPLPSQQISIILTGDPHQQEHRPFSLYESVNKNDAGFGRLPKNQRQFGTEETGKIIFSDSDFRRFGGTSKFGRK